jgi:hypothetical protein
MGHSLDNADASILERLFLKELPDSNIRIYCRNDNSRRKYTEKIKAIIKDENEREARVTYIKSEIELEQALGV